MAYKLTNPYRLKTEADRVQSILSTPKYSNRTFTAEQARTELASIGLSYTQAEVELILTELIVRSILEETAG